ncbi:hypothetical protein JAO76_17790 [Pontibacter sp. BT310]|uniref:Uncharacterized protein n=1 Tax=Pontibacter populi TaxID=890055 RepID=A0ABS6XFZ6_9BACT|nr:MULTISPECIES: ABC-three component system middle component 1 [Pontibacter]MBJ6120063.1 hypothetical protein [Pontibacter sp. BT310]MBR0572492.1 hypothetical protein [Microvirga sp. STS03]MBW3366916.1 hypothetical protein [Pontibacter populi]
MKVEEVKNAILEVVKDHYIVEDPSLISCDLQNILSEDAIKRAVIRIQRRINSAVPMLNTWKTLLIVELKTSSDLKLALKWTSVVQDSLLDPETSDLYLFIAFTEPTALESCLRVESTEQFCRKYVLRPNESPQELLDRSFLCRLESTSQELIGLDPLYNALLDTSSDHIWFDAKEQNRWKVAFLSNLTGGELVDELFTSNGN